jgi:class 3 adenylate cyclase/tetratricopeptide (TPR) repeat protein
MLCPSCASPLVDGARFCSSCGHAVASVQSEERRIVTVLFADVVGFTALAEHLDPEQVKRLIDGAFERLVDDVTSFGGRVDKLLGDGILALFGAPVAHEDDAERAVRAGLRMQETLARYVAEEGSDDPLRMRIGINTGEVLVGTLAGTDYTAMGDVVNTASRLQTEAPPGGVLVGEATHALTADVIEYGPPTELLPRGRERPISTWLALGALTAPGARVRRSDLRLVGRDPELAISRAALRLGIDERRTLLLNVIGESGVGKSRLIDELLDTLDEIGAGTAIVLEGACAPYGESNPWSPIASAIAGHLDFDPSLSADQLRDRARTKAASLLSTDGVTTEIERAVEVFLHLLGHDSALDALDAGARRDMVHRAITRVVEMRTAKGPMVLWIDDLHWADQVVVDLLDHLIGTVQRLPFVLVTSMRPGSDVVWPPSTERTTVLSLTVPPLARADSDELAIELLGQLTAGIEGTTDFVGDQQLLGALFDRSGGNPLFLQQLAEVVAEEGSASELPDSLRALIAARLDQLGVAERQVLDNAATLGLSGTLMALDRFAQAMEQPFDRQTVSQLDAKGFLVVEGQRWRFRSDSVRETTYHTLTKASRAQRHAGVAATLARFAPTACDDLAHHAATAAELVAELGSVDMVPATIRVDAVRALGVAARRAGESGSHRLSVRHATRAISLMYGHPSEAAERTALMLVRCAGLIETREWEVAKADLATVLADATTRGDIKVEGQARRLLGSIHHLQGGAVDARAELGRSVELLRQADAPALLADALRQRGFIELFGGSLPDAEWHFGEAEAVYRELGDERGLAYIEQHRAWLSFLSGDLAAADERLHRAAETHSRLGDRNGVGWAFGLLAFVRFFQRRFAEAEDLADVVQAEATELGDDWAASMMQTLKADLRLWHGNLDEAASLAEQARARFRRLGDRFGMAQALSALVRTQVALGRNAAAQRTVEELLSLGEGSPAGPIPLLAVAGAAMHRGDAKVAATMLRRVEEQLVQRTSGRFEAMILAAIAAAQEGRIDDALEAIDDIPDLAREHPFSRVAVALVASLAGDPETAVREAELVVTTPGATYLDRTIAAVAAAGGHAQLAEHERAREVLDAAIQEAVKVGDVVVIALLQRAHVRVVGTEHASGGGDASALGDGWLHVIAQLPLAEHAA